MQVLWSIILLLISSRCFASTLQNTIPSFLNDLKQKYSHQPTFLQAVEEMASSLSEIFDDPVHGDFYQRAFKIMTEPERTIIFRVPWIDDKGNLRINKGYRVEFSSVLGPYKGGLRFHPTVDEGLLKFLGFEQVFKNALTGLPLGGGKGGSDFDPKDKSEDEIMRFCQSFIIELHRYLGETTDVPAGDIGVSGKEIGFMNGMYKRLVNRHGEGVLTGKSVMTGGSQLRAEATGFGLVYIADMAIRDHECMNFQPLQGSNCAVSGSGNVAQYTALKLIEFGANVISMSDSDGVLYFEKGMTKSDWYTIANAKQNERKRLHQIQDLVSGEYISNKSPWTIQRCKIHYAFPCSTQNELSCKNIAPIIENGLLGVFEGANLPTDLAGQAELRKHPSVIYIPGKAANAGGVGVSGFEMCQNAQKLSWDREVVDQKLQNLMEHIYAQLVNAAGADGTLASGANKAGFLKVAEAMKDLGWLV
jgi:glutamate dehydrogenase (NADP+)